MNSKTRNDVILSSLATGFGISRVISSPIRRYYERHYKSRKKISRFLFLFDAMLIAIVAALLALIAWLVMVPVLPPSVAASFQAPRILAGAATPMSVTLSSKQTGIQSNIRIRWLLAPGVTILESSPRASADGTVELGSISTGETISSHIVVQVLRSDGGPVPIGFRIHVTDNEGFDRDMTSFVNLRVDGSSLQVDIPEAFRADAVALNGVILPLRVQNTSGIPIPFVEIRSTDSSSVSFDPISIGTLEPGEKRYAFIPLGNIADRVHLAWAVFAASRSIVSGTFDAPTKDAPYAKIVDAYSGTDSLIASSDGSAGIHYEMSGNDQRLATVRPFANDDPNGYVMFGDAGNINLPFSPATSTQQRWLVAPVVIDADGKRSLGPGHIGIVQTPIPFETSVVYRSKNGDQLGAGPQPPQQGEETRYWVFWHVGPFDDNTRSIHVSAILPQGIRATGAISNPDGGSWSVNGQRVDWKSIPVLAQGLHETTFAFEIAIRPTADIASSTPLIGTTRVTALDASTGVTLSGSDSEKTVGEVEGN